MPRGFRFGGFGGPRNEPPFSHEDAGPMRELHCEVINPSLRSPCRGCRRELEDKNLCIPDCSRLHLFRVAAGLDREEKPMPEPAGNETKVKAPAPKPRKIVPAVPQKTDTGSPPTLGRIVRRILDGFPGGHEFALDDLRREATALVGHKVNSGTVSTYLSAAIRDGFPATKRRNGHGMPCIYRIEKPAPEKEEAPREPPPASSPKMQPVMIAIEIRRPGRLEYLITIDCGPLLGFLTRVGMGGSR